MGAGSAAVWTLTSVGWSVSAIVGNLARGDAESAFRPASAAQSGARKLFIALERAHHLPHHNNKPPNSPPPARSSNLEINPQQFAMADSEPQPRNRKERRAAAKAAGTPLSSAKAPKPAPSASKIDYSKLPDDQATENELGIPMAMADFSGPKGKTLYDLADERMRELQRSGKHVSSLEGEEVEFPVDGVRVSDGDEFGPGAEALLYAFTMSTIHFTLDVLVHNQYREDINWGEIWSRTAQVAPILWFTVYLFKTATAMRFPRARQAIFFATAVSAGCYCVYMGNMFGYYAVMKRAPPVGVLWIWAVVELQMWYAAASVAVVFGYTWWNNFGLY